MPDSCRSCFEPLHESKMCIHRRQYLDATTYVISQGVRVYAVDYEWWAWRAGRSQKYGHDRLIEISSIAYRLYGWDAMTSVLIHEFGHCVLFNEGTGEGSSAEENLTIEKMANQKGAALMPPHLVPEQYFRYREFFLKSYVEAWTEEKCRAEWDIFRQRSVDFP
jgi:hypothetical protein